MRGVAGYPARAQALRALGLLMLVQILWSLDKHLMTLLLPAIQSDLRISDTQISLLQGFAYALCFSALVVPCGWATDHWNRRNLIIGGVALWSLATMLCGLSHTYGQLVVARMAVGVGEAVLLPTALSMLSDYFPPAQRGRALGVFLTALYMGGGGAYLLGAALLGVLQGMSSISLPLLGPVPLWQAAFLVVGAPGLFVALLLLLVREPPRVHLSSTGTPSVADRQLPSLWRYALQRPAAFVCVIGSYTLMTYVSFGVLAWMPTLLVRSWHATLSQAGFAVGWVQVVAGALASLIAGALGDRWTAQQRRGAKFRLMLAWWIGVWPALLGLTLAVNHSMAMAFYVLFFFLNSLGYVSGSAVIQDLVPPRLRGRTTALWYFISAVVGQGGGPLVTALITDRVFASQAALPYSMLLMATPAVLAGLALSWFGLSKYDGARQAAALLSEEAPELISAASGIHGTVEEEEQERSRAASAR